MLRSSEADEKRCLDQSQWKKSTNPGWVARICCNWFSPREANQQIPWNKVSETVQWSVHKKRNKSLSNDHTDDFCRAELTFIFNNSTGVIGFTSMFRYFILFSLFFSSLPTFCQHVCVGYTFCRSILEIKCLYFMFLTFDIDCLTAAFWWQRL